MPYLLDTNTLVARLNGDLGVAGRLRALGAGQAVTAAPVHAELIYGASLSARRTENLARIEALRQWLPVLPFDRTSAELFGHLKAGLRRRGIARSDFDLAIASIALVHGATLVTADRALHDGSIPDLQVENWL